MEYTGCRALSVDESERILNAFVGRYAARNRTLFLLGIHTGFRISEILSLHVCDVWNGHVVLPSVTVQKAFMKGKGKSRTMLLHDRVRRALAEWIDELTAIEKRSDQKLFPRQRTTVAMTPHQAYGLIRRAAVAAGLGQDRIGTHTMRKTFASRMWASPHVNGDMAKMARLLGHQNWSNTLRYVEFLDGSLSRAVLAA